MRRYRAFAWSIFLLISLLASLPARAERVVLPLTLDNRLLTSLLVKDTFTGANQSAALVGTPGDCTYIGLSRPRFTTVGGLLQLEMQLSIRLGTALGGQCMVPIAWQGYVTLVQQPVFDSRAFALTFRTVDSRLYSLDRQPAAVASALWDFAKPRLLEYFGRVRIDLAPPIREMRDFLAPLFHEQARQSMQAMLDSLGGGAITVDRDGVVVELTAEVAQVFSPEEKPESAALTPEEHRWLVRLWETWDSLLVQLITTIAIDPLRPEDQELLIDVLLDTRHAFVATLDGEDLSRDFVREQFVRAWHDLGPIFRRQLFARDNNSLGYLAFFTAADALTVFDRMGPTFGIEISEQGLLRLATMLTGGQTSLPYSLQVDERLRGLFQLPPAKDDTNPGMENLEEIDVPAIDAPPAEEKKEAKDPLTRIGDFLFPPLWAAETPSFDAILEWRVPDEDIEGYVARVREVLDEASRKVLDRHELPDQLHGMYRRLIVAVAWQESCFRQFEERNAKLTYLLSYNKTSVGVMQVNERVWRGIYDLGRLRWDIRYNALAGCEIADLYLRRHALNDQAPAPGLDLDLLARGVYAMYNGGPGQYTKYLERARGGKTYPSDRAFAEKLEWVTLRDWGRISECLGSG